MGHFNIILLALQVWTFTAVCKAYDSLSIKCDDVTGHVGDKINLTCRVSYPSDTCCMMVYKFMNKDKDTTVCREEFTRDPCEQLTSISCPYTANEVTTTTFKIFTQTPCGPRTTEFTVNIAETPKDEKQTVDETVFTEDTPGKTVLVLTGLVISLVIVVAMMLVVAMIRRKYNCTNNLQRGYDLGEHEENNINEHINTEEV